MQEVFGPDGLIARHHPNYEYRPGQIRMAEAVNDAIENGGVALVEAGTGTGKTLAYLIPALAAERRVIVSTATKNLQEQLYKKDIPFLQKIVRRDFSATCMKGRSNYVCLHRLKKADESPMLYGLEEVDYFDKIRQWAADTDTGDRAELTDLPDDLSFWPQIDARAEICLGSKCPEFEQCFITKMRQRALASDVVIVNHHLFFADLVLRGDDHGGVLPDYSTIIFDEAHEMEDVAATYFGTSVSNYRIMDLVQDAQKLSVTDAHSSMELTKSLARLTQRADRFWPLVSRDEADQGDYGEQDDYGRQSYPSGGARGWGRNRRSNRSDGRYLIERDLFVCRERDGSFKPTPAGEAYVGLLGAIDRLIAGLGIIKDPPPELENIVRRAESLKFDLEFIVIADDPEFVYWWEKRGRSVFLFATPIDVSGILGEKLFANVKSAVLTSATMTADRSFGFIKSRLGVGPARELIVDSHFDFESQAVLYLPERMPDPRSRDYLEASVREIVGILEVTQGRAFVLFTSISSMRETYELVRDRITYPTLIQGQGSKSGLLDKFRNTKGAVLFATASFWQGVDVQGEALSCVIISKLPFAVPTDPVVSARQRHIDQEGGNSFYDYSVPEAIISLKQGLGRLIRSTTDRGILSVLDPRLRTKAYGRLFLQSLPPCRVTGKLEEAAEVFRS
jgi:ATP-dependent DNA helicase DinG